MNIGITSLKTLQAGGTELVKLMDKKLGVSKIIRDAGIKKKGLGLDKIALSLVAARIDNPNSVRGSVRDLKNLSAAPAELGIDPEKATEKTFYRGLEMLGEHAKGLYPKVFDAVEKHCDTIDLSVTFMDWTSVYFHGTMCEISRFGHSKEKRNDKEQIKLGLAVNDKQALPFSYSVEKGNLAEPEHFKRDFLQIRDRLPEGALVVFDKGPKSKANCDLVTNNEEVEEGDNDNSKKKNNKRCEWLTGVKEYQWVRDKVKTIDKSEMEFVMEYKKKKGEEESKKVFVHYEEVDGVHRYQFYDERRAAQDARKRDKRIRKVLGEKAELEELLKNKGPKALRKKLTKKKRKKNKELNGVVVVTTQVTIQKRLAKKTDEEIVAEMEEDSKYLDGFYALESSVKLTPKKALKTYRKKDKAEKLFSDLKTALRIRPFRVWSENAVRGAALICMLSALFIGLNQWLTGFANKTKQTITNRLKSLTVVLRLDKFGRILTKEHANLTDFLVKFLHLPCG